MKKEQVRGGYGKQNFCQCDNNLSPVNLDIYMNFI
jgi:hypothetical protein